MIIDFASEFNDLLISIDIYKDSVVYNDLTGETTNERVKVGSVRGEIQPETDKLVKDLGGEDVSSYITVFVVDKKEVVLTEELFIYHSGGYWRAQGILHWERQGGFAKLSAKLEI